MGVGITANTKISGHLKKNKSKKFAVIVKINK